MSSGQNLSLLNICLYVCGCLYTVHIQYICVRRRLNHLCILYLSVHALASSFVHLCVVKVIIHMSIIAFYLTPPTHKQHLISLDYLHTSLGTLVWLIITLS